MRTAAFDRGLDFAFDEWRKARAQQLHRLAHTLLVGHGHESALHVFKQTGLNRTALSALAREANDLRPALHQPVISKRFSFALLALSDDIEAIG